MKKKEIKNKYWENENGELIEFGHSFLRCYDEAGKLQFGTAYFDSKTGDKKYTVKFVLDRKDLMNSAEGMSYLRQTLEDWEEDYED